MFFPAGTITHAETGARLDLRVASADIRARAMHLASLGTGPGAVVVIRHGGTPRFFADLLSVWTAGAAAACINPATTPSELDTIVDFVNPVAVLTDGDGDGSVLGRPVLNLAKAALREHPLAGASLDDPALVLFTSGSTGAPKGVVLGYRALLARAALNRAHIGDAALARTLCVLPTHFGHGLIGNCLTPLLAGRDLVLASGGDLKSVARLGEVVDRYDIGFLSSVPAFWKIALKAAKRPQKAALRRVHIGSAPLSGELWRAVAEWSGTDAVLNMYGMTEAANWIAGAPAAEMGFEDGLVGRMWGGAAAVRRGDGSLARSGDGDLVVQTPSLMTGYFKRDDLTRDALSGGWLATGDVGSIDETGIVRLTGRRKHEINRAGLKVHPEDVDALLERHPDVVEACSFGIPDAIAGESVGVAVVVKNPAADAKALRAWAVQHMVPEKIPTSWHIVPQIPRNDRGKVNRDDVARLVRGDKP